ncbi:hypothetical protein [Hoeflea alexandrii]|uniref:Uncharacterized protein n=1 Tax=Hoeflea alexandrii TaxID=288436 RepID=A0ABT1CMC1_9HYPH|nr:hypothetical protein [Hoeflea alexandrii]MCO6407358.1 hypothetical protein [Hoeflea alexandrii]
MVKVTNTGDTKQHVHTTGGVVTIYPGKTRDVELSGPGAKLVDRSDVLEVKVRRGRKAVKAK